ncbi:MAG: acyl-CoA synthetase [Pseudomonadota bacterium]
MGTFSNVADARAIEQDVPWAQRDLPHTIYGFLCRAAEAYPDSRAISYQLLSGPKDKAETLTWAALLAKTTQAANLFRNLGVGETDVVACVLPNASETVFTILGGATAGIINPINPLLEADQIGAILAETGAKVVVTLKAFPKTDVAQKTAAAVALAPNVETVLEVDLARYLTPPKSWIVPFIRPKIAVAHRAKVLDFNAELARQPKTLSFDDSSEDRVGAYFHTGGTTGTPKVARHKYSGMIYNGWIGNTLLFTEDDTLMCPLPLFHVFACNVVLMSAVASGAHVVFPTPAGYRGDGVMDNFWKLIERWQVTFIITVPTAISALMQRPVDADISCVETAFSGSAPLPVELYNRFQRATGVNIIEGYGLTEATCLVSCNPIDGQKKIGSVGIPFPYTNAKILVHTADGVMEQATDDVGEICVASPGVIPGATYTESDKNRNLFHYDTYLRTGDLGRIDEDGFLWITGRAKDLIIRGGHNIDPAVIEEALAGHDAVAMVGAIGQPDAYAGELPCAYVELVEGATATEAALMNYATTHISERAAHPKHIEVVEELPKTAVGKVFKPALRGHAITRIYDKALADAGLQAHVVGVRDDKKLGLVAQINQTVGIDADAVQAALGQFTRPWEWAQ